MLHDTIKALRINTEERSSLRALERVAGDAKARLKRCSSYQRIYTNAMIGIAQRKAQLDEHPLDRILSELISELDEAESRIYEVDDGSSAETALKAIADIRECIHLFGPDGNIITQMAVLIEGEDDRGIIAENVAIIEDYLSH